MDQNSMMGGVPPMQNPNNGMNGTNFGAQMQPMSQTAMPNGMPNAMPNGMNMNGGMMRPAMAAPTAPSYAGAPAVEKKGGNPLLETIILVLVCLIAAAAIVAAVIFFMRWNELNTSFESEVAVKVAENENKKQEEINAAIREYANKDTIEYVGPSDFGSLSFQYPRSWSVYEDSDGMSKNDFKSYFRPGAVTPVSDRSSRYALRFFIYNRPVEEVTQTYITKVTNGELTSTAFSADNGNISGTRYEGLIDNGIQGVAVVIKINDKTAVFQTDSVEYKANFDALLETLRRNS